MGQLKHFSHDAQEAGVDPSLAMRFWLEGMTADDAIAAAIAATPPEEIEEAKSESLVKSFFSSHFI